MSICSRHLRKTKGCSACHSMPQDLFPNWDEMKKKAEAAGTTTCECGFVYYRTIAFCPLCYRPDPTPRCMTEGMFDSPVRINSLFIHRTYGGCLEGGPAPEQSIDLAKKRVNRMYGENRPLLVLDPPVKNGLLPRWEFLVWLDGPAPSRDDDGSHLVVIYWADEPSFDITPLLARFNWADHAQGFSF